MTTVFGPLDPVFDISKHNQPLLERMRRAEESGYVREWVNACRSLWATSEVTVSAPFYAALKRATDEWNEVFGVEINGPSKLIMNADGNQILVRCADKE